jgi:hypothetical protein
MEDKIHPNYEYTPLFWVHNFSFITTKNMYSQSHTQQVPGSKNNERTSIDIFR